MLPQPFFNWWFAPWTYASNVRVRLPFASDWLGQRDGYRMWCEQTKVAADLPERFDPAWHVAMADGGAELIAIARLFAGLIAAREHNQAVLGQLAFADRKWCVSIAATQPLRGCRELPYGPEDAIEVRGLLELARRLEPAFPGLWSRLRLMLPAAICDRVEELLEPALAAENAEVSAVRAQRCWTLCRGRLATAAPLDENVADDSAAQMT
jgi:hypothetical protein